MHCWKTFFIVLIHKYDKAFIYSTIISYDSQITTYDYKNITYDSAIISYDLLMDDEVFMFSSVS